MNVSRPDSERALIHQACASAPGAWDRLVAMHGPAIWSAVSRVCPDPADAYQDAWAKIIVSLPTFSPEGTASLRTWMLTITHRQLVDRWRRRKLRQVEPLYEEEAPAEGGSPPGLRLDLELSLATLPESHRRAIVFYHLQDRDLDEIAQAEGVPVGTIKSRLHRGRAALAMMLGDPR